MTSRKKILVVDDSPDVAEVLRNFAERLGYDTRMATSAKAAKDLFREFQPDIVVLDVVMPDTDGVEYLRWLGREFPNRAAILVVSGFPGEYVTSMHRLSEPLNAGISRFLSKPVRLEAFGKALDELIAARENPPAE
ncbi:MAG: hypothetical protein RL477_342 [Pseudomonadota bacterium]|jgi:CheY-like chemotaxis protein